MPHDPSRAGCSERAFGYVDDVFGLGLVVAASSVGSIASSLGGVEDATGDSEHGPDEHGSGRAGVLEPPQGQSGKAAVDDCTEGLEFGFG